MQKIFEVIRKIFKKKLKIFRVILLIISMFLIILSIISVGFTIWDSFELELAFNKQGFIYYLGLFDSFKTLLTATFIIIPVYIALETFISNINNQEGKALLDLRNLLNKPENLEIHRKYRAVSGDWAA